MNNILITSRNNYGKIVMYPACEKGYNIAQTLMRRETFTYEDLSVLMEAGIAFKKDNNLVPYKWSKKSK